jgi:hypothetical protein
MHVVLKVDASHGTAELITLQLGGKRQARARQEYSEQPSNMYLASRCSSLL